MSIAPRAVAANALRQRDRLRWSPIVVAERVANKVFDIEKLLVDQPQRADADCRKLLSDKPTDGSRPDDEDRAAYARVTCKDAVLGKLAQSNFC
jgi:hypothetical protein